MKIALFDEYKLGLVQGDFLVDVSGIGSRILHNGPQQLIEGLISSFAEHGPQLQAMADAGPKRPLNEVRLRPPVPKPGNIVCMAVNYNDGLIPAGEINAFHKAPSVVVGPGDTMVLPDIPATVFEGEAELGVVIGKYTDTVNEEDALKHVFGYVNFIDGSARGMGGGSNYFFQVKSRATFAPIGPYIVTADEIPDPQALDVRLWVNDVLKQEFSTASMASPIARCISWISKIHPLFPGDIVATGTNHVGLSALQHGDVVKLVTRGLGTLSITVHDALKRTWGRETRGDRRGMNPHMAPQLSGKYAATI